MAYTNRSEEFMGMMNKDSERLYWEHNYSGKCVCVDCEDYRNFDPEGEWERRQEQRMEEED